MGNGGEGGRKEDWAGELVHWIVVRAAEF